MHPIAFRFARHEGLAVAILVLAPVIARADASPPSAPPELRQRVEGLVTALSSGDPTTFEAFVKEQFDAEAAARRTPEQRRQMLAKVHGDLGRLTLRALTPSGPWSVDASVDGEHGTRATISVELDAAPPHRIQRMGIQLDSGDDGRPRTALPALPDLHGVTTSQALSAALAPYLGALAADGRLSGAVLVARGGQPLYRAAFGLADEAHEVPNTVDTRFNIASIGKQFTHVAIGQLLAAGKLALGDTIGKILPDYPNEAAKKATIQQLLDHQAGIVDIFRAPAPAVPPRSNREWMAAVAPLPLDFEPGKETRYCNGCYVVLGEIVARVAGTTYEDFVTTHVFGPAGMTHTAFLGDDAAEPGKARGYTRGARGLEISSLGPGARGSGAGGVFSTVDDLLAYDNALRGYRLLDRERTAWMLGGDTSGARADGALDVAGGAPGINADLASNGDWTVVVLTNHDPRLGEDLGSALAKALPH